MDADPPAQGVNFAGRITQEDADQALGSNTKPSTKYRIIIEQPFNAYMIKTQDFERNGKSFKQRHFSRYCVDDDRRTL